MSAAWSPQSPRDAIRSPLLTILSKCTRDSFSFYWPVNFILWLYDSALPHCYANRSRHVIMLFLQPCLFAEVTQFTSDVFLGGHSWICTTTHAIPCNFWLTSSDSSHPPYFHTLIGTYRIPCPSTPPRCPFLSSRCRGQDPRPIRCFSVCLHGRSNRQSRLRPCLAPGASLGRQSRPSRSWPPGSWRSGTCAPRSP